MELSSELKPAMFSCAQLADFRLPGCPSTNRGWRKRVEAEGWPFREVKSRGRGGIRREYLPPAAVQALIDARQRGELPAAAPVAARPAAPCAEAPSTPAYQAQAAPVAPWINIEALTQAILAMQQLRPNEPLAAQVTKGVEFYLYCVERGMVTRDGNGPGDLKGAA